jgi:type IV pilus assembly protein PilM
MLPLLRKRSRATVALDIGSNKVKCVRIDHSGDTPMLTHFAMVDLLPEAIVDGEIMDRDMVVEAIRECVGRAGVPETSVVSAVGGRSVIVKKILMDKMAQADANEAILWEAEQHVPFDIDDISLDFQIINEDIGADQMEILLVAARKETVQQHIELLRDAELEPDIVDVHAFAIQNSFEAAVGGAGDEVVALLDIGGDVTNLAIIRDGTPHFTRDIATGANFVVEEFQKRFGMTDEDARRACVHPDEFDGVDSDQIIEIIKDVADELATGIERSLSFLRTSGEVEAIDRVVMTGGGSQFPGLDTILGSRAELPVETCDPLSAVDYDPELFAQYEVDEVAPMLAVGVGLGLRRTGDKS